MPPGNPSQILSSRNAFRKEMITDLLYAKNIDAQVDAGKKTIEERSKTNKDNVVDIHKNNKQEGFGIKSHPGYENGHDTEQGNIHEAKMSAEELLRQDRQNGIEFVPNALEIARENYLDVAKTYAAVEQKHRSMMEGLNKWFNSTNLGSKIIGTRIGKRFKYEDNADVKGEKNRFEDSLKAYRDVWKKDIERRMNFEEGTGGRLAGDGLRAEIAKMLAEFNCEAALELGVQRNFAKAEMLWGGKTKTKYKKPLQKADAGFDGEQQSFTGRDTRLSQIGKPKLGINGESVYDDVYENGEHSSNAMVAGHEKKSIKEKLNEKISDLKETLTDKETYKNIVCGGFENGWAGLEMIGGAYKKLPTSVKLGLGVATWASGMGALVVGKRIIGGVAAGVGTAGALNARQEQTFKKKTAAGNELNLKEIEKEGVVDFDVLMKITDRQIEQIDEKMNELKVGTWFNRAAGITLGTLLGTGWGMQAAKYGYGKVWENAKPYMEKTWSGAKHLYRAAGFVTPAGAAEIPASQMHVGVGAAVQNEYTQFQDINTPHLPASLIDVEHSQAPAIDMHSTVPINTAEALNTSTMENAATSESMDTHLTIEKGGSIERTLIKHLKAVHPEGMKDYGQSAHRMWLDYMHDNKDSIVAKVGDGEYHKMLKDGMVNVKPGTVLMIDEHDPLKFKLDNIDGKISHLNGHHASAVHHDLNIETPKTSVSYDSPIKVSAENVADIDHTTIQHWNDEIIGAEKVDLAADSDKYQIASAITRGEVPTLDAASPNYQENLRYAEMLKEGAKRFNWAPSYEMGRIGTVIKQAHEHMQSLASMPDEKTFTKIGRDFFDSKKSNILKFGGMNVREALGDPENSLKGLSNEAKRLIVGYAASDETKPKVGENFRVWSYRIMKIVKEKQAEKINSLAA